jgi:O-methyltransferase/methyltransferase family protein
MDPTQRISQLVNGYQVSQAVHVAARLELSDLLADGPRSVEDLAEATSTHAPTLARLLRALESIGIYQRDDAGRYANTELSEPLRRDVPGSIAGWAAFIGRPHYWHAWAGLIDSVRSGENAFAAVHGMPVWEYRKDRPEEQAAFDRAMNARSGVVARGVADSYDFGRFETVLDVGGGTGTLLAEILSRHPGVRGVIFDQPGVVAAAGEVLGPAGVADRCETVGGDFFESVPPGADAYLLKAIIHDWMDPESVAILSRCREAIPDDGVLLLVEQILGEGSDAARTAFSDLNMLVGPGGRERTVDEYRALLAAGGFTLTRVVDTGTAVYVIEATPVGTSPGG